MLTNFGKKERILKPDKPLKLECGDRIIYGDGYQIFIEQNSCCLSFPSRSYKLKGLGKRNVALSQNLDSLQDIEGYLKYCPSLVDESGFINITFEQLVFAKNVTNSIENKAEDLKNYLNKKRQKL